MIPSLNPVTAGGGLPLSEYVALARANNFSGVDFSIQTAAKLASETSFPAVAAIFESNKVLPVTFGLPVEWRKDEDTFLEGLANLPALAKLAQDLDCTRCTTWVLPDGGTPVAEYAATSTRRFVEIAKILADQGVRLGLEFIGPKHFRTNPDNVWFYDIPGALRVVGEMSQAAQLENVGLLVDSFHWYTSGGSTMDLASIPVEQVVHVHINDAPDVVRDEQRDNVRLLPGTSGVIDLTGFLKTLAAIGYDGPVAVETFSDDLKAMGPQQAAQLAGEAVGRALQVAQIEPVRLL